MNKNNNILVSSHLKYPQYSSFERWVGATSNQIQQLFEVHFIFCDQTQMAIYNANLRGKYGPTDIITESYDQCTGSIYLCDDLIKIKHADIKDPYPYLTIHGLLHLASFDHKTDETHHEMVKMEKEILQQLQFIHPEENA